METSKRRLSSPSLAAIVGWHIAAFRYQHFDVVSILDVRIKCRAIWLKIFFSYFVIAALEFYLL